MTEPRSKSEVLSETTKSYIKELFLEREYNIRKEISSRYLDKGIEVEDESIQLASQVNDWDFVVKNETRFNNEYITGEPDICTDTLLVDIKSSWSLHTFRMFDKELKNKDYYWQLQGYMWLTGHKVSQLSYCLINTPFLIVEDEVRRAHWKANLIDESEELRAEVEAMHNFDHIPNEKRVKTFEVVYNEADIERLKTRIEQCREYYESLKSE